jgi:hypothetical protein
LAAEELAKFLSLIKIQPLKQSDWQRHTAKHIGAASFLLRRYQAALAKILDGRIEKLEHVRFAQLDFRDEEMPIFDEVLQHVVNDRSLKHFSDAFSKETDKRKQQGFYVDLGADHGIDAAHCRRASFFG